LTPPRRRVTANAVKRSLLVFSEGAVTEEGYLLHYWRLHRRAVTVEIDEFHGTPLALVQRAAKAKRRNERVASRQGRAHDEVWCVFDVDDHPQLAEALAMAREHGIHLAISNPCIELWFLLHFEDQTAYIERRQVQSLAKEKLGCGKRLDDDALGALQEGFEEAKERAQRLDVKHEGDGSGANANPSSGVWRLVDSIADASFNPSR
jgi:hypothetical protein